MRMHNSVSISFSGKGHTNHDMANLPLVIKEKDVKYQVSVFFSDIISNYRSSHLVAKITLHKTMYICLLIAVFTYCDLSAHASRLPVHSSKSMERSSDRHIATLSQTYLGIAVGYWAWCSSKICCHWQGNLDTYRPANRSWHSPLSSSKWKIIIQSYIPTQESVLKKL